MNSLYGRVPLSVNPLLPAPEIYLIKNIKYPLTLLVLFLGLVFSPENHQALGLQYFEETALRRWQCVHESRKGEVEKVPSIVITAREQLRIRTSGTCREDNRQKIM